jgi:general stress protein CsbA
MTPAEFYFMVAQIFLARTLNRFVALLFAVMWLCVAIYKGW